MFDQYTLNEEKKRFELRSNLCLACKSNPSVSIQDNIHYTLCKVKSDANYIVYRTMTYNKIDLMLPRCKSCAKIHRNNRLISFLAGFAFFGFAIYSFVLALNYYTFATWLFIVLLLSLFLSFAVSALIVVPIVALYRNTKKNIEDLEEIKKNDPLSHHLISDGWYFCLA